MVIETATFKLVADADEAAFLEADHRVQTEFIPNHPGFIRRTTARGVDEEWLTVALWYSEADAVSSQALWPTHDATIAFMSFVDVESVRVKRYTDIGG